jgi:hypothetical protein
MPAAVDDFPLRTGVLLPPFNPTTGNRFNKAALQSRV